MKFAELSLFRVSVPSVIIGGMFIFAYIGILPLYFGWDIYRYRGGVQDKELIMRMLIYSSVTIILMVLGFLFANKCLFAGPLIPSSKRIRPLKSTERWLLLVSLLFCTLILVLYIARVPRVALFVAFSEGLQEAKVARSLMGNAFAGTYRWYKIVMRDMLGLVSYALFSDWLIRRRKAGFLLFIISFLIVSFSLLLATEKAPFAWFLIGLFLSYLITVKKGTLRAKSVLELLIMLIIFLVPIYVGFMGTKDVGSSIFSIFSRTFTGGISPAYFYLDFFPTHHDFLWGRSFVNFARIFPFEPYQLSVEIMNWRFPHLVERGIVGSMPTVFWGELYANFGPGGVFLVPFFVGVFLYIVSFLANKLEQTPIKSAYIVWLMLHYVSLAESGIAGYLADFYLVAISAFVVFMLTVTNHGRLRYYRSVSMPYETSSTDFSDKNFKT